MAVTIIPKHVFVTRILRIGPTEKDGTRKVELDGGQHIVGTPSMFNKFGAQVGDFYVVPSEGQPYFASKAMFTIVQ